MTGLAHPLATAVMHLRQWLKKERLPADGDRVEIHVVFRDRRHAVAAEDLARMDMALGDHTHYPAVTIDPDGLKIAGIPVRFTSDEKEALREVRALIDAHLSRRS